MDAKQPKVRCIQGPRGTKTDVKPLPGAVDVPENEDCLVLNVFTPLHPKGQRLPVLVFLHGGGNMWGAGSDADGRYLSEAGEVIVVTLNYRLAALGGLVLPELDREIGHASGNLIVRDQQLALRWVQDNIRAFSGDPANVTLFGESGGSVDVCYQLFAQGSQGLFQRAILESGVCVSEGVKLFDKDPAKAVERSQELVTAFCPNATDVLGCLRAADASQLGSWSPSAWSMADFAGTFGTYIDGEIIEVSPSTLLASGRVNKVPVIVGTNANELFLARAEFFGAPWPLFEDATALAAFELLAPGLLAAYDVNPVELPFLEVERINDVGVRILGDLAFRCPSRALARGLSQLTEVYMYSFELTPAVHGQELDYVFGWPGGIFSPLFPEAEHPPTAAVIEVVQKYWTSFGTTGKPLGPVAWPRYQTPQDEHLLLDKQVGTARGLARAACDIIGNSPGLNVLAP